MDKQALMDAVSAQMPERRWEHTLGVMAASRQLAERYKADAERAELAAILHDVAKYWQTDRLEACIRANGLPHELLRYGKQLWHAPVGALVAERDYGVTDAEVLDAIRYHTSGRPGMGLLEQIVCVADYIEPGRDFPGVDDIRQLAEHSLERALVAGLDSTIRFLLDKNKQIYPLTFAARNDLLHKLEQGLQS